MSDLIDKLSAPFDPSVVKQRDGRGGLKLDYIAGEDVLSRYLDTLGFDWGWSINDVQIVDQGVFVRGTLGIQGAEEDNHVFARRDGIGASTLEKRDLDDAVKIANTEAFKNAAKHFGTSLYLWYEEERDKIAQYRAGELVPTDDLLGLKMEVYEKAQIDMDSADPDPSYIAEFYGVTLNQLGEEDILRGILDGEIPITRHTS